MNAFNLEIPAVFGWVLMCVLGLVGASFANVVIYRLPLILRRAWGELSVGSDFQEKSSEKLSLSWPASHCISCKQPLRWWHNVPLFSWLKQKGQCAFCAAPIPKRYLFVEAAGAVLGLAVAFKFGWGLAGWVFLALCLAWLCLAVIDAQTKLLPDALTLPLVWAGLSWHWLLSSSQMFNQAFLGALVGYLSLWSLFWVFKLLTGRDGMGYGDFKLLAGIGAWLGAPALVPVVLLASLLGLLAALVLKLRQAWQGQALPFGPYLIGAAYLVTLGGAELLSKIGFSDWLIITQWAF